MHLVLAILGNHMGLFQRVNDEPKVLLPDYVWILCHKVFDFFKLNNAELKYYIVDVLSFCQCNGAHNNISFLIAEKLMSLVCEKSVRVFLDLLLGWLKAHLQIQRTWHGILVYL
jgi:hypothetical protein